MTYCYSYITIESYYLLVSSDISSCGYDNMKCHSFYTFYYPPLKARVEHIASIYETCQNVQNYLMLGFGELPPRNALLLQCSEVTVDFIGPWKITLTAQAIEFHAPTWVNTVTNLPEISHINNKTSEYIAMKFKNDWLDGYLRPEGCIHDNGGQFTGIPFIHM